MFVDPKKPLPVETGEKKDRIGAVMESIIQINNANMENGGDPESLKKIIAQVKTEGEKEIEEFVTEMKDLLEDHTDLKGAVHGETKKSIGLYYKENWRMSTDQEHIDGISTDTFVHPFGLHKLVEGRVGVDPDAYIRANIIPITSGGLLGDICQWPYDWATGVHIESGRKTKDFYTDSPWTFSTPTGTMHFPTMEGDRVLTNTKPAPGRPPMAITAWGGTQIRVYNKQVDLRRSRPQLLRGWSSDEPRGRLLVASAHLFDRNSVFFCEDSWVGVRSFNKNVLPFDILSNNNLSKTNWDGIIETRENLGYNIVSNIEFTTFNDISTTKGLYLVITINPFTFVDSGMAAEHGPGCSGEQMATIDKMFKTLKFNLPADGSIKVVKGTGDVNDRLVIPLNQYFIGPKFEMQKFYDTAVDTVRAELINFAWINRLAGEFTMRIPVGIQNNTLTQYWHRYFDFNVKVADDIANLTSTITISHKDMVAKPIQEFDETFNTKTEGYLRPHQYSVAMDWAHPRCFDGVFEGAGGHIKTYTMHNRQYVGFYQHDLKNPKDWMYNPTPNGGLDSKYNYTQMSTINADGFYGDHLRHIPLRVNGVDVVYLTRTRDYQHKYSWALATVEKQDKALNYSPYNQYVGPWRDGIKWVTFDDNKIPSFVIHNDPDSSTMNITNLVFNDANGFLGKASFVLDRNADNNPLTFGPDIKLDTSIWAFIQEVDQDWKRPVRQIFLMDGCLFYFTQTLDPKEKASPWIEDCHIGVIKGAYVDGDTVKITGDIKANAFKKGIMVNHVSSMTVDGKNVIGLDAYDSTDVYAIKTSVDSTKTVYDMMVNLAPFNNFYFEFKYTKNADGTLDLSPSTDNRDQVFPYGTTTGFSVEYDKVIAYGTKVPHRLHTNFQTPVMLSKGMWALRKSPSSYGFFTKSDGFVKVGSGVMDNLDGLQVVPIGGFITIKGKNFMCREPLTVRALEGDLGHLHDEIYCRPEGNTLVAYTVGRNPMKYETEPHNGAAPLGFIDDGMFYHYDQHGYRNALMPVVDGKRLSVYSYGSTIPAFLGKRGSGQPINRYYLTTETTHLQWQGSKGRSIPIIGKDVKITIDGVDYPYDGSGTFEYPFAGIGIGNVYISGLTKVKWAPGLIGIQRFGSEVTELDFKGSSAFNMGAPLPRRFTVLAGIFEGGTADRWPGIERWDVTNILDFSGMFKDCKFFNHNISVWKPSSGKHFGYMFAGCTAFTQNLPSWDVQKAITMNNMFQGTGITAASELNNWNVSNVQNFSGMFKDCPEFNADISKWNVSCGMDFSEMFMNTSKFNRSLSDWNFRSAKTVRSMFDGAKAFNSALSGLKMPYCTDFVRMFADAVVFNGGLGTWTYAAGADFSEMFNGARKCSQPINTWKMEEVVSCRAMFKNSGGQIRPGPFVFNKCTNFDEMYYASSPVQFDKYEFPKDRKFTMNRMFAANNTMNPPLGDWDVSNCTSMSGMFDGVMFWKEGDPGRSLENWNVSGVTDFSRMFAGNSGDPAHTMKMIEKWDMSSARNISGMLEGLRYAIPDLSKWNVSKVTNLSNFAAGCDRFNSDVSLWKTNAAITMEGMFKGAKAFNQPLNTWVVSNVTNMASMFEGALAFNQPINSWNVVKVTSMANMFSGAIAFNQDISSWKVTNLRTITSMFKGAVKFNADIGSWTVGKTTNMDDLFANASAFNQDVGNWDVSLVTSMNRTFSSAVVFNQDLSKWNVQRVTARLMFDDNTPVWTKSKPIWKS